MKFLCLGYLDPVAWNDLPQATQNAMMEECLAYDDELRRGGHFLGGEALQPATNAVTVRPRQGKAVVTDGPFVETKEFLGGILFLEARDLNHVIQLMSAHPGVRMGGFEIRPVDEAMNAVLAERQAAFDSKR